MTHHVENVSYCTYYNGTAVARKVGRLNTYFVLQSELVPVLAFSERALPAIETIPVYIKDVNPRMSTVPHGSAALEVACSVPQCPVDTGCFPRGESE